MDNAERMVGAVNALLNRFLVRSADGVDRPIPYNPVDYGVLRFISEHPDPRATDIGRAIGVSATTLQSGLDRLVRRGLLVKRAHPTDGRARIYSLTDEGTSIHAAIVAQDVTNMRAMLSVLPAAEQDMIVSGLDRIAESLSRSVRGED